MGKTAKDDATGAGLGAMDAMKAAAATGKNMGILVAAVPKVKKIPVLIKEAIHKFVELAKGVKAIEPEVDKVGAEGHKKGLRKPRDCFWDLHPGKKLAHKNELPAHREKLEKEREIKEKKEEKIEEKK